MNTAPQDPTINPVPLELLQVLADSWTESNPDPFHTGNGHVEGGGNEAAQSQFTSRLMVEKWLQDRGVSYRIKDAKASGNRTVYILEQCPFNPEHGSTKEV